MVIATRQKHPFLSPTQLRLPIEKTAIQQVYEHRVLCVISLMQKLNDNHILIICVKLYPKTRSSFHNSGTMYML